jgi:branched-chain amino acid transport system ATP-binding protein
LSVPLLEIRGLTVRYGAIQALHGVDLTVEKGEIVTLIGGNGAGKSTTLRTISGLIRPAAGTVLFEGRSLVGLAPHRILRLGVAHAPEGRGIFPELTVDENLAVGAYARSDHAEIARARERALELFPRLRERLRQRAGTLSGGEQQMLAIARALLARPRLLLLDEPSLGLAPQLVMTIFKIVREINEAGATILLVEQNAHMALHVAHRAYVLEVGRIAMSGPAKELAASDAVRKAYLGGS